MKIKWSIVLPVALLLTSTLQAQVDFPWEKDELMLLGRPNPILADIERVQLFVIPQPHDINIPGISFADMEKQFAEKIADVNLKIEPVYTAETGSLRTAEIPELKVGIDILALPDSNAFVYRIETALAARTFLCQDTSRFIKPDIWIKQTPLKYAPGHKLAKNIQDDAAVQVEAFILSVAAHKHAVAQLQRSAQPDSNPEKSPNPASAASNDCVSSKNSKIFHRADCSSASRISPDNRVTYESRQQAIDAGKRPCKRCNP